MKKQGFFYVLILFLSSCVGTDFIDDSDMIPEPMEREVTKEKYIGQFSGKGSYSVSGDVSIYENESNEIIVEFAENFSASTGPGLYVYLSNSNNGVAGGVELGKLESNTGGQLYNVSLIDNTLSLESYNHVIVHCKPFNVVFGYAELN